MKVRLLFLLLFCCALLCAAGYCAAQPRMAIVDSLVHELKTKGATNEKVGMLLRLSFMYSSIDPERGIKYAEEGLALAQKLDFAYGIGEAYNDLAINYACKSDMTRALQYLEKGMAECMARGEKKSLHKIIGNIGKIYCDQGNYSDALEYDMRALALAEELNDKRSIAINQANIASVYQYLRNYTKAVEYNLKALHMNEAASDTPNMAIILGNMGNIYTEAAQYDQALQYHQRVLSIYRRMNHAEGIGRTLVNMATIHMRRHTYSEALKSAAEAHQIFEKLESKIGLCKTNNVTGDIYLQMAKDTTGGFTASRKQTASEAVKYLVKGAALATELNSLDDLQYAYDMLTEAHALAANATDAFNSYVQYKAVHDSVYSLESRLKVTNLETKRELQLKDKQIEIDRLEVAKKRNERVFFIAGFVLLIVVIVIVVRNIKLKAARELSENKLNAFQARMNPHFIFNSLNSIQSLVLNNENEASIDYLSEFATLMRQILDNSARSKVSLQTEIEMLRSYIQLEHLRFDCFTWDITLADNVQPERIDVPGMIVQPFVENAILHGLIPKGRDGVLHINIVRAGNQLVCTVDDNGIGRERSAELNARKDKSRQSHGVNIATTRLTLLNNKKGGTINRVVYVDKMNGNISAGTRVTIQIPIL